MVAPPLLTLDVAAPRSRKQKRRVKTRRQGVEGVQDSLAQRDTSSLATRLRALLQPPLRIHTTNMNDVLVPVDVTPLQRDPFLRAQAGAGSEHLTSSNGGLALHVLDR